MIKIDTVSPLTGDELFPNLLDIRSDLADFTARNELRLAGITRCTTASWSPHVKVSFTGVMIIESEPDELVIAATFTRDVTFWVAKVLQGLPKINALRLTPTDPPHRQIFRHDDLNEFVHLLTSALDENNARRDP